MRRPVALLIAALVSGIAAAQDPPPAPPPAPTDRPPEPAPEPRPEPTSPGLAPPPEARTLDQPPRDIPRLPEIVVTPTLGPRAAFDAPATVRIAGGDVLFERRGHRTVPEALGDLAGVGIQKTAQGQGSPYLRGFTGFRTLTLLDGLRLNAPVYRDGPNEYMSLVDPWTLDRLEVVEGPGSVLYGSDAVGGTVNLLTRRILGEAPWPVPEGTTPGPVQWRRRLAYRYGGADLSHSVRGEIAARISDRLGARVGGTWRDYDNVDGGRHLGVQPRTGYTVRAADVVAEWRVADAVLLRATGVHTAQDDAWRTHATVFGTPWHGTTIGTDLARVLDHERSIGALHLEVARAGDWLRDAVVSVSAGRLGEVQDRTRSTTAREVASFVDTTYTVAAHAATPLLGARVLYGIDWTHDLVQSRRESYAAGTGLFTGFDIQGPVADDARYDLLGGFAEVEAPVASWLELITGARGTWSDVYAGAVRDPVTKAEISLDDTYRDLSAAGRVLFRPGDSLRVFAGAAQSFRAPNLSDLTRLDTARSNELEIPSPGLRPERYTTVEGGVRWREGPLRAEASAYYTWIRDLIDRTPTGNVVAGKLEVVKRNVGDGYVMGASGTVESRLPILGLPEVRVGCGASWAQGAVETFPTSAPVRERRPLSKVPPATLLARVGYEPADGAWFVEAVCRAARAQERLSPGDERDTERIPPGGTPGYAVFSLRGGATVSPGLRLHVAIENLGDRDYRHHGSGVNEPGLHAVLGGSWEF